MSLDNAARTAIHDCLALGSGEACAIVTDDDRLAIGEALYHAASDVTEDTVLLRYPPGPQHGAEPPKPVAAAMREADVVLAPTTKSLSHTRARQAATDAGARIATLPGITRDVMIAGLDADYERIAATCEEMYERVRDATAIRVETPAGTDLTVEPGDREWRSDTGLCHAPGDFSNLPAGEVFVSPTTADGRIVVDGTMAPHGLVDEPFGIEVADGRVTDIADDAVRAEVEAAEESAGDAARNVAEFGIGTNTGVHELVGSVLLDEKAAGTVHVAIGDDAGIGGDVDAPIHLDAVLRSPTVTVDGEPLALPAAGD
jgi:leucyl aminopeptidase (aminopeptidase T)